MQIQSMNASELEIGGWMKGISKLTPLLQRQDLTPSLVFVIMVLGGVLLLGQAAHGEANQAEEANMISDSLEQRGKQLRVALEQTYKKMAGAKILSADPRVDNDVTDVVVRFIPVGTSFDDAENILRSARFEVSPRPSTNQTGTRSDRYDVVGSIDPFVQGFLSRASIYVHLRPIAPGNYSKVSKVGAEFVLSYP